MFFKKRRPYREALAFPAEKGRVYDEEESLTRYVWEYYTPLMTDLERRVGGVIFARAKAESYGNREMWDEILKRWASVGDPEVEAALKDGPKTFRRRVKDRLLRDHPDELPINRCPRCSRIVRTPKARLCLWCGYDWHSLDAPLKSGETGDDRG
jgi:hypothetical protein